MNDRCANKAISRASSHICITLSSITPSLQRRSNYAVKAAYWQSVFVRASVESPTASLPVPSLLSVLWCWSIISKSKTYFWWYKQCCCCSLFDNVVAWASIPMLSVIWPTDWPSQLIDDVSRTQATTSLHNILHHNRWRQCVVIRHCWINLLVVVAPGCFSIARCFTRRFPYTTAARVLCV